MPLDAHFAIGNFIYDALYNNEINVAGDGSPIRSYMNQVDLAKWLLCILDKGTSGRAYNVGSDQAISVLDLAYLVRNNLSPNKLVVIKNDRSSYQGRNIYIPNIDRAEHELNLKLTISLEESIKEFIPI